MMFKIKNLFKYIAILLLVVGSLYAGDNSRLGGENGELWHIGQNVHIWWDAEKITSPSVNLYLWDGTETKLIKIAENIKNATASFDWQIPESINPGDLYKIKIVSTENARNFIMSENFFSIYDKLAIEEQNSTAEQNAISIFPNPASDYIYISSTLINGTGVVWKYQIYDILGNCVQNGTIESDKINISRLSSGFYTVRFFNGGKQVVEKMMKE